MTTDTRNAASRSGAGFTTPEKAARYDTGRYQGATGLNWYACDPALQRTLRFYMPARDYEWAQPYLSEWGCAHGWAGDARGRGD